MRKEHGALEPLYAGDSAGASSASIARSEHPEFLLRD